MNSKTDTVQNLRTLLREKFPEASGPSLPVLKEDPGVPGETASTTIVDQLFSARSQLQEILSPRPSTGSALLIAHLLERSARENQYLALVDAADTLDPAFLGAERAAWLFWSRCQNVEKALRVTDFLLRDGNLPRLILDLESVPRRALTGFSQSVWYRLRALVERSGTSLTVFSRTPNVPAAHTRFTLERSLPLSALDLPENEILARLHLKRTRGRHDHTSPPASREDRKLSA